MNLRTVRRRVRPKLPLAEFGCFNPLITQALSTLWLVEPSMLNYELEEVSGRLSEGLRSLRTIGTGPLRFGGSKDTAAEAMVPEAVPCAGNPESRCGEANARIRPEGQATRTHRRVDRTIIHA